jgi:hypothetical protein
MGANNVEALDSENLLVEDKTKLPGCAVGDDSRLGRLFGSATSLSRLVTGRLVMPQGLMREKSRRSVVTLKAKPCEVTPRAT